MQKLCEAANAPSDTAMRIAEGLRLAWTTGDSAGQHGADRAAHGGAAGVVRRRSAALERLETFIVLLPVPTTVNLNTADVEVIAAVSPALDAGAAQAIVQARTRSPFKSM